MQEENYLGILEQSLKKKCNVLNRIRVKNEQQRILLLDENLEPEEFEKNIQEKADLVDQLNFLDEGFEGTYDHVQEFLKNNSNEYREQIRQLQELIRQITAESNSIQAEEERNYTLAQKKFASVKKQIREVKASQKAVHQYYRNMTKTNYVDAQFMDNKK